MREEFNLRLFRACRSGNEKARWCAGFIRSASIRVCGELTKSGWQQSGRGDRT